MDPRKLFFDERLRGRCPYCGGPCDTRDHVPSKIFLDEPYPENLPVVEACLDCNNRLSSDEQYLACLIDCVMSGSSQPTEKHRSKIRRTLEERPAISAEIELGRTTGKNGEKLWLPDGEKMNAVIMKLARGHVAYEYGETHTEEPEYIEIVALLSMSSEERRQFEEISLLQPWPEIGSRAFMRAVVTTGNGRLDPGWQIVQEGRYRYLVSCAPALSVKFVIGECLACDIGW